jgi:hypothetical protein
MHAGGHDPLAGFQPAPHDPAVVAVGRHLDVTQRHFQALRIDHENLGVRRLVQQRRTGKPRGRNGAGGDAGENGRAEAECDRWIFQRDLDPPRPRHGVGLRRDFAHLSFDADRRIELQGDDEGLADGQRFGNSVGGVDHRVATRGFGDGDDGLARLDHLADFSAGGRHHAFIVRLEFGIGQLLSGLHDIGLGLDHGGLGGGAGLLGGIERRLGDGSFFEQRRLPGFVGHGVLIFRAGARQGGQGRARRHLQRKGIDGGEQLPRHDRVAGLDRPRDHPPRHPEGEGALHLRLHRAGQHLVKRWRGRHDQRHGRTHGLLNRLLGFFAGGERDDQHERRQKGKTGAHERSAISVRTI